MKKKQRGITVFHILAVLLILSISAYYYSANKRQRSKEHALTVIEENKKSEALVKIETENAALKVRQEDGKKIDQYAKSLKATDDLYQRWHDGVKLALSVSRIALAQPVAALQSIKTDAANLEAPPCLDIAKKALISGMDLSIEGFLGFMKNEAGIGDRTAQIFFAPARVEFDRFEDLRKACPQQ
ncbi:MAG: hypothetical protein WCG50_09180 [Rhodoferax sp.]|uniref:hypothetical protein n=1 Tax=Rhodoferax sp. TaxID=50421 RepID=UPI003017B8F8